MDISNDFALAVSMGLVKGWRAETVFGSIVSTTGGAQDDVSPTPFVRSAGFFVRVKLGGNALDTVGGIGAESIRMICLDENGNIALQDLDLAGASASAQTSIKVNQVLSAWVVSTGTAPTNIGDVVIESTVSVILAIIPAGEGKTQQCFTVIPSGHTGFLIGKSFSVIDTEGAGSVQHIAHFRIKTSELNTGDTWLTQWNSGTSTDGSGSQHSIEPTAIEIPENAAVKMTVYSHAAGANANASMFLLIRDDSQL